MSASRRNGAEPEERSVTGNFRSTSSKSMMALSGGRTASTDGLWARHLGVSLMVGLLAHDHEVPVLWSWFIQLSVS